MNELNENLAQAIKLLFKEKSSIYPYKQLGFSEMTLLTYVYEHMSHDTHISLIQMKDIAYALKISRPALTQTVNRLEAKQLLRRVSDDTKRATYLKLSKTGETIFLTERARFNKEINGIINTLGKEKCEDFIQTLNIILHFLEKFRNDGYDV